MNIDLKAFKNETYSKIQKGSLENVKNTIYKSYERGCHIEITTLVVTGINDDFNELKDIADYISSIDKNIPWHISRYYPNYNYDEPPTDMDFMIKVYEMATQKLNFVYTGNIPSNYPGSQTNCPSCSELIIDRNGYFTKIQNLKKGGLCGNCNTPLYIAN